MIGAAGSSMAEIFVFNIPVKGNGKKMIFTHQCGVFEPGTKKIEYEMLTVPENQNIPAGHAPATCPTSDCTRFTIICVCLCS